jgi:hypothetical protein
LSATKAGLIQIGEGVALGVNGVAMSIEFAHVGSCGVIDFGAGSSFSGSYGSGTRYLCETNGVIDTHGAGSTFLPGTVGGSTATGGQYA